MVHLDGRVTNCGRDYRAHAMYLGITTFGLRRDPERMGAAEKYSPISLWVLVRECPPRWGRNGDP